ncbi:hypothetical protein ACHAQA_009967 [Verticillium albo-atrum]
MNASHREILSRPAAAQDDSPLYSVLPGEVRNQIFTFALTDYEDPNPERQYNTTTCFTRPSYFAPRKTDSQLLRTCRAIYKECWHLPFTLKEQMYWITSDDRAPPEFRTAGLELTNWLKKIAELQGEDKVEVDRLRVFAQMYKLEEGGMERLLKTPFFQPRSITLTIRHTDWWFWEDDNPLRFQGAWIKSACAVLPNSVREIRIELESLQRKQNQVDDIATQMTQRWFFKRPDGAVLYADGVTEVSRWTGRSTWHQQQWIRDEIAPGKIAYYIRTVSFRPEPVIERRGGKVSPMAQGAAARNRFVTGCSSGMGKALADIIASHPTQRLVATARSVSKLSSNFPTENPRVLLKDLDVNSADSIKTAFDSAVAKFGRIDVVINNAGYGLMGDTESFVTNAEDMEKARKVVETNFWGTAQVSAQAVRIFREDNSKCGQIGGVVLNVTSIGGFTGFPGSSFYHASKFAVEGYTESLCKEMRPEWNIHFCIIEPGGTKTNFANDGMTWLSPHPAYTALDTPTRLLESYVKSPDMQATWAPSEHVAAAMYEVVARRKAIPLRLPTGAPAWNVIKDECEEVNRALLEVKELSFSIDDGLINKSGEFLKAFER